VPDAARAAWKPLVALGVATLAYSLQQTLVVPALPAYQREFGTSGTWVTWVITGYLLSSAVSAPVLGRLGDQHGRHRMLVLCLLLFLAGTIGSACAWNIGSLIGFRIVMGFGFAVFPLSFGIIRDELPPERVAAGLGAISAVFGVGGSIGVVISGVVIDHLSWRWLFGGGAVFTACAIVLVKRLVPPSRPHAADPPDIPGAVLLSAGIVALLVALSEGNVWGWAATPTLALLAFSAALFTVWGLVELRSRAPMVDLRLMALPPVALANGVGLISGFSVYAAWVIVPAFVQASKTETDYGLGMSATGAGLILLPSLAAMLGGGTLIGPITRRIGGQATIIVALALSGAGSAMLAVLHDSAVQVGLGMFVLGAGISLTMAGMPKVITDAVPQTHTGVATGMNMVARTVGGVLGAQLAAALVAASAIGDGLPGESGYTQAFLLAAGGAAVGVVVASVALRAAGRGERGARARSGAA
jgi:MFS family permease